MKKLKVLHVSETFITGVYTYIKTICAFTAKHPRLETTIIYSPNREGTADLDFDQDFDASVTLIPLSMQREVSPLEDYQSLQALKKLIRSIQPDVIHLHSSKAGILGRVASRVCPSARVYYTPNGYAFLRQDVSQLKRKLFYTFEKYTAKLYGGTTIACGDTEFYHAKKIGKSVMVRNGIDLNELQPLKTSLPVRLKTVVTLGRISAQKNPELFNAIAQKFPELDFVWIGDGELRHLLKATNIRVTGWLNREDALSQLAMHDVYLQTSLWEGLPFTIIEAMALNKPVLATDVIGNKDAVEHNKNGFLCKTLEDFEKSINQILENPELLKIFGEQSKTIAQEKFDRDKNFKDLVQIYLDQDQ